MSDINLVSIQAGLGVSLERFAKIYKIVQIEAEKGGLGNKTLKTNQMKKELDNLVKKIKKKVEKH